MNNDRWESQIGSDLWKNLIREECRAISKRKTRRQTEGDGAAGQGGGSTSLGISHGDYSEEQPKSAFFFRVLADGEPRSQRSFLIFQTGRWFLVGASREGVEGLKEQKIRKEGKETKLLDGLWKRESKIPLHVVLLTFDDDHVQGLFDLLSEVPDKHEPSDKRLTVWTSSWIWEESLRLLAKGGAPKTRQELLNLTYMTSEDVGAKLETDRPDLKGCVVACEREMDLALTIGVRLQMDYVPSDSPSLRVVFTCNQSRIIIDPLREPSLHSQLGREAKENLRRVYDRLRTNIRSIPALSNESFIRRGRLEDAFGQHEPKPLPAERHNSDGWFVPQPRKEVSHVLDEPIEVCTFPDPVDLTMLEKQLTHIEFASSDTSGTDDTEQGGPIPVHAPTSSRAWSADDVLAETAVAILCGGLVQKRQRELLDPGRKVRGQLPDGKHRNVSILEWHLHHLYDLVRRKDEDLRDFPVLLMTSPDTEAIVEERVAHFVDDQKERGEKVDRLKFWFLRQQLVPLVQDEREEEAELQPWESKDGGWELEVRGHLDILHLLERWRSERDEKERARKVPGLCVVTSHNNLGRVFDSTMLKYLRVMRGKNAELAVEMFELDRGRDADEQWNSISYSVDPPSWDRIRLYKERFRKPPCGRRPAAYSSHTWYVNLEKVGVLVRDERVLEEGELARYVREKRGDRLRLRRDLDQCAHDPRLSVFGIPHEPGKEGIYGAERFLVVRTEDQLRDEEFEKKFNDAHTPAKYKRKGLTKDDDASALQKVPFVVTEPAEMHYVWGGRTIRMRKGQPDALVAETWEASTHPAGHAQFFRNLRERGGLAELVDLHPDGGARPKDVKLKNLPYMVKYLDCQEPISIQVHPPDEYVGEGRGRRKKSFAEWLQAQGHRIKDKHGKEESFYVLHAAEHEPFHLYLGFDRRRLDPIAQFVEPFLTELANASTDRERSRLYKELLAELGIALYDDCVSHVVRMLYLRGKEKEKFRRAFDRLFDIDKKTLGDESEMEVENSSLTENQGGPVEEGDGETQKEMPEDEREEEAEDGSLRKKEGAASKEADRRFQKEIELTRATLTKVLEYHLKRRKSSQRPASLSERSYLFAAIGIIGVFKLIADYVRELDDDERVLVRARPLFGYARADAQQDPARSPLLKYFCPQRVSAHSWVRVPPGTVHSWQGGGNFLIEIGQMSDNTFRILDFGRELETTTKREMHYAQAMYSLRTESILDSESGKQLIFDSRRETGRTEQRHKCHAALDYDLIHGEGWCRVPEVKGGWSAIMNPDNPIRVRTRLPKDSPAGAREADAKNQARTGPSTDPKDKDTDFAESSVERCRTVLVAPGARVAIRPTQRDDRVLHIFERPEEIIRREEKEADERRKKASEEQ